MKKIFAFASAALMLVSCVVSEQTNNNRTDYNLFRFTSEMISSSVEVTLRNLVSNLGVNDEGLSFTGTVDPDIRPVITRVGDNAWTSVYKGSSLEFSVNVRRIEADDELEEKWVFSGLELSCQEDNGYGFSLVTDGEVEYTWKRDDGSFRVTYDLVPTGSYKARFLLDGKELDWCNVSYYDGDMSSSSSTKGK